MRVFFKGFNYSQDGPGNRLVYHLQGCNMRCPWCSNPEGMSADGGEAITPAQIADEAERSRAMFFSGGGVTFTGGEATLHPRELMQTLKLLRQKGIHTAVETNGTSPRLPELSPYIDYLIMDFKHCDPEAFERRTGVAFHFLLDNFAALTKSGRQLHIRIPLINHVNADSPESFADLFSHYDTQNTVFEFLPYHEYGKKKWKAPYRITDGFITDAQLQKFYTVFEERHLKTVRT